MHSIKRNLGLQTFYQVLNTCVPIITAPYLARMLGAEQLGVYSYCHSIATYFLMFTTLGVVNYGTKKIAMCGDDIEKRSNTFWSIYLFQLCSSLLSLFFYLAFILTITKENHFYLLILVVYVASGMFDISWLYFGIEKFEKTIFALTIVRVCSVIAILQCVNSQRDLWIYMLITATGAFMSQFMLWFSLPRQIKFSKSTYINIGSHIKPNLMLFIPILAMSVYHIMDKTMLGILSTDAESGYYYNVDKLINTPVGIITGFGSELLPRLSALFATSQKESANKLFAFSVDGIVCVCVAMAFGLAAIANEFVPVFLGDGYDKCVILIILLSPVLIIKGFSYTARSQYLIPMGKEKTFIASTLIGAFVNLIMNILLIPQYGSVGAVIATLLAELLACMAQYVSVQQMISLKSVYITTGLYVLVGFSMFIMVRVTASLLTGNFITLISGILAGILVYSLGCIMIGIFRKQTFASTVTDMIFSMRKR